MKNTVVIGKNLKTAFFLKYYTPEEVYEDRCYIYNFWPPDGESISQVWGD
jgi:hypothetical protein